MNTPVHKKTRASKPTLFSNGTEAAKNTQVSIYSPSSAVLALDQRFEKLSSTLAKTLTDSITGSLTKLIQTEIFQCEQRIISEVNKNLSETEANLLKSVNSLKSDLNLLAERVTSLEAQCAEINALRQEICLLRAHNDEVAEQISSLERVADDAGISKAEIRDLQIQVLKQENSLVADELRLNGIPFHKDENILALFECICSKFNLTLPNLKCIYRLQNRNNKKNNISPDAVIIVKFLSPYDKNFFLKRLFEFKKRHNYTLSLNDIGFDSNMPIYINENLSNKNYKIFREAVKLKKDKCVQSAYTFRGLVYVKRNPTDEPICIVHLDTLGGFRQNRT